jgi:tyrosinase
MAYDDVTDPPEPDPTQPGEPQVRVRPDVWGLDEWDDTLLWYARAVAAMRQRPIADPTSWRYQAAIHAYNRGGDPYADPGDVLPGNGEQQRFWNQCQHGTWFFLPWHRMYLGYFEQIVAAAVEELGGSAGWSLPYWNYSDESNPDARRIPPAFRAPTLPDGSPNALRVGQRVPAANSGGIVLSDDEVDVSDSLDETVFIGTAFGGTSGFGGLQTAFNHSGGAPGKLEMTPHGDVHVAVGGSFPLPTGFMSRFNTAGLDPLFWLHHANIDRLWTVWKKRRAGNLDPAQSEWLDEPDFELHDAAGSVVTLTSSQVADSASSLFGYRYEDESDPLAAPADTGLAAAAAAGEEGAMGSEPAGPAEMVGATEERTVLRGRAVTRRVELQPAAGPAAAAVADESSAPRRVHLSIENVTGPEPMPHLVYVNLPEGADPVQHPERLAGSLSMFGLAEASGEDPDHPGSGLQYSLDITGVVERLGEDWSPDELRVTLVPKRVAGQELSAAAAAADAAPPAIEIGRISVYRGR